ncbi:MAG: hypothetical protein IKH57_12320 [Clostridia bacterium]|nr:hypothetical protein [Clostridia bacterium]
MKNKNAVIAIAVVAVLLIGGIALYWNLTHGNRQLFDTKYRFNYAIIRLPNGEVVEGKVTSWLDFDQSDTVQITMDGKTYLTHYMNVCLINE